MNHRYILEPYRGIKSRFTCPQCDSRLRCFKRYIDTHTGKYIGDEVGMCDRRDNCGYHYTPKQYFEKHGHPAKPHHDELRPLPEREALSLIPCQYAWGSLRHYDHNHLIAFLVKTLGSYTTWQLARTFHIGTARKWHGATVFWQIDIHEQVRSGKIMLYNPETGKRVKEPFSHIAWVHRLKDNNDEPLFPNFHLRQCFFGEHQLIDEPNKPVAIVESEKTAIIATAFIPQFVWLAAGSKDGLTADKCKVLEGRRVILYPDLNAYDEWKRKAGKLFNRFSISGVLERNATEQKRREGWDLADYLLVAEG